MRRSIVARATSPRLEANMKWMSGRFSNGTTSCMQTPNVFTLSPVRTTNSALPALRHCTFYLFMMPSRVDFRGEKKARNALQRRLIKSVIELCDMNNLLSFSRLPEPFVFISFSRSGFPFIFPLAWQGNSTWCVLHTFDGNASSQFARSLGAAA